MIKQLNEIAEKLAGSELLTIAIAGADEDEILLANEVVRLNLAKFILIGDVEKINGFLAKHNIDPKSFTIVHEPRSSEAALKTMEYLQTQQADLPMKGLMATETFMKAVLDPNVGLRTARRITQITVFDGYNGELQFLTDCAINIKPNLNAKKDIIDNAVVLAKSFGYELPLVALLGSVETVNENMPDTLDSAILTQMNRRGQITGCIVDGPLSLDNAISLKAAKRKGIDSLVAGRAQVLVVDDLQVSNTLSKALNYYAKIQSASVIMGTKRPIIMTSRTDSKENKINAIIAACYLHKQIN